MVCTGLDYSLGYDMLNFVVCDDDAVFLNNLTKKISEKLVGLPEDVEGYVYSFNNAEGVLKFAESKPVHILFLDIDMKGMNGFDLARELQIISPETLVIFVSAYDNFVYSSFKFSPFDYIRKSHIEEEFPAVFSNAVQKFFSDNKTVVFKTVDGDLNIRVKDIIYIESEKNYFDVHCGKNSVLRCRGTISNAEDQLLSYDFYRIHPAILVNMENIRSSKSNRQLIMKDGTEFMISMRKYNGFRTAYLEFSRRRVVRL